ncbi:SAM-dependent methyltransferase [Hoeflea sp. YIM 152468]|uniref:protein-L-isoaspartate O-methyltransferase family protein n=1 Tax=Hoeflea sp. YIM 152468 TaxID=3031759 RepID=UPI0023DBADE9|nr:methyltransferase domain-containing protein [Hoeflea sp. YIM 152468]MDF1609049.1 SAM-dependent methyltransferase [Hoeflea sp. YIM 152468]
MADSRLDDVRRLFAKLMFAASGSSDPRLERVFETIRREAFVGPGPWNMVFRRRYVQTPSDDPIHLYQNLLIGLDEAKGINNGEPFLHARWLGTVAIQPGELVTHIGAGTGYYSAIMSLLVRPGGWVTAMEIDQDLAGRAKQNLKPFDNVSVLVGDATQMPIPASDVIYVNAGVIRPPVSWLEALNQNGRLIFPWSPAPDTGLALLVTRHSGHFDVRPLMPVGFIPCLGASDAGLSFHAPDASSVWQVKSLHLRKDREPDASAIAVCDAVWFSNAAASE